MKRFVFMSHRIRQKNPDGPVIVVQDADGGQVEANEFELRFDGFKIGRIVFDPRGLPQCKTHDVKAWVELVGNVEITPAGFERKPASAKKPNQVVKVNSLKLLSG